MEKFTTFTAISAPLNIINIDTDMIIPKQFLKTIKRTGLGANVFDEMRFNTDGSEIADFILNQKYYRNSRILVAGDNFGCGSSREHAPWALADFGIKTIIAHSFADIFYNNCFKNAILPIKLPQEQVSVLMENSNNEGDTELNINLENQTITNSKGDVIKFELDAFRKKCLLEGLDDIGLTMQKFDKIKAFEKQYKKQVPWLFDKKDLSDAC